MGLDLDYIDGQTPLDDDEKEGLLIPEISTRGELDEFEQKNIEQAIQWTLQKNFKQEDIFTEMFLRDVQCGPGPGSSEKLIKILELINGK